jgi:hypothetical protein
MRAMPFSVRLMAIGVFSHRRSRHGPCRMLSRLGIGQPCAQQWLSRRYLGQCQQPINNSPGESVVIHLPASEGGPGTSLYSGKEPARPSSHVFALREEPPPFQVGLISRVRGVDQNFGLPKWNGSGNPSSIARSVTAPADVPGGHEGKGRRRWRLPPANTQPEPLAIS